MFVIVAPDARGQGGSGTYSLYIVRHAEKHPGKDSTLMPEGHRRAGDLARWLKDKGIKRIYITPYKRSMQTGDSLRLLTRLDTAYYKPDTTGAGLLEAIAAHKDGGKNLLIIGHSNTVIPLVKAMGGTPDISVIGDTEFDHLFIISIGGKKILTRHEHYGVKTPVPEVIKPAMAQ
jgi:phosphohistidine phosphatase SixA